MTDARKTPPATTSDTRRAARPSTKRAASDRERVLGALIRRGPLGATDHELAAELGLLIDTCRARRVELLHDALVVDSGRRRPSPSGHRATVWIVRTAAATATGARARPDEHRVDAPGPIYPAGAPIPDRPDPAAPEAAASWRCPRCGCTTCQDVPIHDGRSTRRDCARCGRAVGFPVWQGQPRDLE